MAVTSFVSNLLNTNDAHLVQDTFVPKCTRFTAYSLPQSGVEEASSSPLSANA